MIPRIPSLEVNAASGALLPIGWTPSSPSGFSEQSADSLQASYGSLANPQLRTRYRDASRTSLVTERVERPVGALAPGGILVEILHVPLHGSFWLSTHPDGIHPRRDEFLADGEFTFGNGGVGRVVAVDRSVARVGVGDVVAIFGHVPCNHHDCYACHVLHRYTECDYDQATILGHGKGAGDGTLARYCQLPPHSYEVCYSADQHVPPDRLKALMYAFLVADVRNALTRHPDTLRNRRMLLIGAGMSGHLAAYIHSRSCPESQILVVDPCEQRLESIRRLAPEAIATFALPADVASQLDIARKSPEVRSRLLEVIADLQAAMRAHFGGRTCNLLFDCSSGNSTPLWDNRDILSPACHCIPFGFGSENILLDRSLIQLSGLNLLMSRGVGNIRNRRETIELIKAGAADVINDLLIDKAVHLNSFDDAERFVRAQQDPPKPLHEITPAILSPAADPSPRHGKESADHGAWPRPPHTRPTSASLQTGRRCNPLEIEAVRVTPIALSDPPLLNAAGLHAAWALRIVVQIIGRGGAVGLAEVPASSATLAALRVAAGAVVGGDARQIHPLLAKVDEELNRAQHQDDRGDKPWDGRSRVHVHSALDVACLDLCARHYETRVCDLLGGAVRQNVPFAGYLFFKFVGDGGHRGDQTDPMSTGWAAARGRQALDADEIVGQAAAMQGEFGFQSFKLKAGILEPDREVEALLALREYLGPSVPLRIDPNAVWSVPTALRMAERMRGVLEYYEDPVRGQQAMAEVRRVTGIPLATNMATTSFDQLPESVRLASEDIILSDHHFWGGLRPSLELARLCKTFKRGYSMHSNSHAGISLAAMIHLAVCIPNLDYALDTHYPWQATDIIAGGKFAFRDGCVSIPDGPGLGVTVDSDALQQAASDYEACGLTDRDDQTELRKHWPEWTFMSTRY